MKSNRIISVLLIIATLFSLFSCDIHDLYPGGQNDPHNNYPGSQTGDEEKGEGHVTYVYSVTSKVIHLPSCYHTERMKDELKIEFTGDINQLLSKGYRICKTCLLQDSDGDEEDEPTKNENSMPDENSTYGINIKTRVFHDLDCHYLKNLNEDNRAYTFLTYDELLSLDYAPCGSCLKGK